MNRRLLLESLLESKPQLSAPSISVEGTNLKIQEVADAENYDIYIDDVLIQTLNVKPTTPFSNITLSNSGLSGQNYEKYILNNGTPTNYPSQSTVLNNVSNLQISCSYIFEYVEVDIYINNQWSWGSTFGGDDLVDPIDITPYLQDGCRVNVRYRD